MASLPGYPSAGSIEHGILASVQSTSLVIYNTTSLEVVQRTQLEPDLSSKARTVKICVSSPARILVASETAIHVFEAFEPSFHASIVAAAAPTGRIVHLAFLNPKEILAFSDFGFKATIWNVESGLGVEVRDPKPLRGTLGYSLRPESQHLALLARPSGGKDYLLVLEPGKRETVVNCTLESQDASGIRWSPDGRWLAIWEATHLGPGVWVYTADGQLFQRWTGNSGMVVELGVCSCEWTTDGQWLLLGTNEEQIIALGARTFTPHFTFSTTTSITVAPPGKVFQEAIAATHPATRSWTSAQQPAVPPSGSSNALRTAGSSASLANPIASSITHLVASPSGSFVAIVSASAPTTVWILQLPTGSHGAARTEAVLIHHHAIKTLEWHPNAIPQLLLVHTVFPGVSGTGATSHSTGDLHPTTELADACWAHVYAPSYSSPLPLRLPLPPHVQAGSASSLPGRDASIRTALAWISGTNGGTDPLKVLLSTLLGCSIVTLPRADGSDRQPIITGEGPEDAFDERYGDTSASSCNHGQVGEEYENRHDEGVDDTFVFKTRNQQGEGRGTRIR